MRYYFATTTHAAQMAKTLKHKMNAAGHSLTLSACKDTIAVLFGYRHWPDFTASHNSQPASPSDHGVDEATKAERASSFIDRLVQATSIDRALAETIIAELQPMRFAALTGTPSWRNQLKAYWRDLDYADAAANTIAIHTAGALEKPVAYTSTLVEGLGHLHVTVFKPWAEPPQNFRFMDIYYHVESVDDHTPTAHGNFYAIQRGHHWRDGANINFCHACDYYLEDAVLPLIDRGLDVIFERSDLIHIDYFGRAPQAPAGHGMQALHAAVRQFKLYRPSFKIGSLSYMNDPAQYDELDRQVQMLRKDSEAARKNLEAYIKKAKYPFDLVVPIVTGASIGYGGALPTIISRMKDVFGLDSDMDEDEEKPSHQSGNPSGAAGQSFCDAIRLAHLHGQMQSGGLFSTLSLAEVIAPMERIDAGEPQLYGTESHPWPDDFDGNLACTFAKISLHEKAWDAMPSELLALEIVPDPTQRMGLTAQSSENSKPFFHIAYHFENGTSLRLTPFDIGHINIDDIVPTALLSNEHAFLTESPCTKKIAALSLFKILKMHTLLFFACSKDEAMRHGLDALPACRIMRDGIYPKANIAA